MIGHLAHRHEPNVGKAVAGGCGGISACVDRGKILEREDPSHEGVVGAWNEQRAVLGEKLA